MRRRSLLSKVLVRLWFGSLLAAGLPFLAAAEMPEVDRAHQKTWKLALSNEVHCRQQKHNPGCYVLHPPGQRGEEKLTVIVEDALDPGLGDCLGSQRGSVQIQAQDQRSARIQYELTVAVQLARNGSSDFRSGPDHALALRLEAEDLLTALRGREERVVQEIFADRDVAESLECLLPGVADAMSHRIRESFPTYGFEQLRATRLGIYPRSVDIEPGMRLCVESTQTLQWNDRSYRRPGPSRCYPMGRLQQSSGAASTLGFHPLAERLTDFDTHVGHLVRGPNQLVFGDAKHVASGIDLTREYQSSYRIFYPQTFDPLAVRVPEMLDEKIDKLPVLVGASSRTDLDTVAACTRDDLSLEELCEGLDENHKKYEQCPSGSEISCSIFTEDGFPVPEIQVWFDDEPVWVSVGTPIIDLLEQRFELGIEELLAAGAVESANRRAQRILQDFKLYRFFDGLHAEVGFDKEVGVGALYLPLAKGDSVQW